MRSLRAGASSVLPLFGRLSLRSLTVRDRQSSIVRGGARAPSRGSPSATSSRAPRRAPDRPPARSAGYRGERGSRPLGHVQQGEECRATMPAVSKVERRARAQGREVDHAPCGAVGQDWRAPPPAITRRQATQPGGGVVGESRRAAPPDAIQGHRQHDKPSGESSEGHSGVANVVDCRCRRRRLQALDGWRELTTGLIGALVESQKLSAQPALADMTVALADHRQFGHCSRTGGAHAPSRDRGTISRKLGASHDPGDNRLSSRGRARRTAGITRRNSSGMGRSVTSG